MDDFELPVTCLWETDGWVIRLPVNLDLGIAGTIFRNIPFRIDSGSDFTHIPIQLATGISQFRMPVRRRVRYRSATGTGESDLIDFTFSFARFRDMTFHARGVLNSDIPYGLLALRDILSNWNLMILSPIFRRGVYDRGSSHAGGSIRLELRPGHQGVAHRLG